MNSSSGDETERVAHAVRGHAAVAHRQHLVGEAERVAHRAVGGARDRRERFGLGADLLFAEDVRQALANLGRTDALEVEALEPAQDRRRGLRDLLRLGRREHEHDARRRLLENLEQRVPRFAREHVRFVDDVDLVAIVAGGRVHRALAQLARVVDAAVRRRVDLDDVEARRAAPDAPARRALAARLAVERGIAAPLAVERHRSTRASVVLPTPRGPQRR